MKQYPILSTVYNIVTLTSLKICLFLIFSNFPIVPEKLLVKMVKKAVPTGKISKKVRLNHTFKKTLENYFCKNLF
jgi:hypothetical protein